MARLTAAEKRLLTFPPTRQTWRCKGYVQIEGEKKLCGNISVGMAHKCFLCGKKKPAKPDLLWPEYERACAKAGIEPLTKWRESDAPKPAAPVRRKGRKR